MPVGKIISLLLVATGIAVYICRIFHGRKYLLCSLILVVAAMLPFFMMFEGRKPKAREIMVISVLAAIGVAGRAAFFILPELQTGCVNCNPYRGFLWW